MSFLLATAAPAQSSSPNVGIPLTPTTETAGAVTTTATSAPAGLTETTSQGSTNQPTTAMGQGTLPVTVSTAPNLGVQTGEAALVPPVTGFSPLNPGWKAAVMDVQVWPEYDKPAVLVIMNFDLPAEVQLPATLKFAVPKGAVIAGIGEIGPSGSFKYNYGDSYPPVEPGADWDIVTIQVQDFRSLQIDYYYDPGLPAGAGGRSFPLLLQVPLDAGTLSLRVQEPARATDFKVQPFMQGSSEAADGFTYSAATFSEVKAGSTLGYFISYSKPDGELSTSPGQAASTQVSTNNVLLAAILIIVVCVGGYVVYRLYRNAGRAAPTKGRARPRTRPIPAAPPAATKGKRAAANAGSVAIEKGEAVSRYCFACGEGLLKKARFCQSCGEAQDG